jgi:uncharacterized membrane protein YcaP (DUF421 family)
MMKGIYFDSFESLISRLVITIQAYLAMVVLLRVTGKRTLSKMNAFDFIITVALGSALANVALNKDVPLIDGVVVFFLLIFLQLIITWVSARYRPFKKLITSQPSLLLYKGQPDEKVLKEQRITKEELYLVARSKGIFELSDVDAIILETTGKITIIENLPPHSAETLSNVQNFPDNDPGH